MKILINLMKAVKIIGEINNENDILIMQNDRWESILEKMTLLGDEY